jgi:hypothetical protein
MEPLATTTDTDIVTAIREAQARLSIRVICWYSLEEGEPYTRAQLRDMEELARELPQAKRFWTQERGFVLRDDGFFQTCVNPGRGLKVQREPEIITIRSQWALRRLQPREQRGIAAQLNITPSRLERLVAPWQ